MTIARYVRGLAAIILCASLASCEDEQPTSSTSYDTLSTTRVAIATGTVRLMRSSNVRDFPTGTLIESAYSRTSSSTREVRRGFAEFARPSFDGTLSKAVLSLKPRNGGSPTPVPPDTHVVSWYRANQLVELVDFDRSATQIATFLTDNNDTERPTLYFDVTDALRASAGDAIGFRVELKNDMSMNTNGVLGMTFSGTSTVGTPELLITSLRAR